MGFKELRLLRIESLAAGGTDSTSWTATYDGIIHRIIVTDDTGAAVSNVDLTIKIDEVPLTQEKVSAAILGPDVVNNPVLDYPIGKDQKIEVSATNKGGSAVTLYITLVMHTPQ